jgi:hypothetical protein
VKFRPSRRSVAPLFVAESSWEIAANLISNKMVIYDYPT